MCVTKRDSLRLLRSGVMGVTTPQMQMKTVGCWTGCHCENVNMASVNLSHGPADCHWGGMDYEHWDRFRLMVQSEFKLDILKKETHFMPTLDQMLQLNLPIKQCVQQSGDMIQVGNGFTHWVWADSYKPDVTPHNYCVNTAWNLVKHTSPVLDTMVQRFRLNDETGFTNLITTGQLYLDLVNQCYEEILNNK